MPDNKKEENVIKKNDEEIVLNRPITEEDVVKFNEMGSVTIVLKNTFRQDPNILLKLKDTVNIKIIGGLNFRDFNTIGTKSYGQTIYKPEEVSQIVKVFDELEKGINPRWTDLEKSTYLYVSLMTLMAPIRDKNEDKYSINPLLRIFERKSDALGFATLYKELLDRNGVAGRLIKNANGYAWNEVLIGDTYYPADLYADAVLNIPNLEKGGFELRRFLSDREFYSEPEHKFFEGFKPEVNAIDHERIQAAIDNIFHPQEPRRVELKSKELQAIFETGEITDESELPEVKEIRLNVDSSNTEEIAEDLKELGKQYPQLLKEVALVNTTDNHVDLQKVVDSLYEGRAIEQNGESVTTHPVEITIESSNPEDFDIDFSKPPRVIEGKGNAEKTDSPRPSQKISFINTSGSTMKMPDLTGKIPDSIETIHIHDFDVKDFYISYNDTIGPRSNIRRLELSGGYLHGIADIIGLDEVGVLSLNNLDPVEFDSVMNLAIYDSVSMPKLFDLRVFNQNLRGRDFLSEITNPNIVSLIVQNSQLDNIHGFNSIKDRLVILDLWGNELSIDDMKVIANESRNNPLLRMGFGRNVALLDTIDNLPNNALSDETYYYLESYFDRSGYRNYRNMTYHLGTTLDDKKRNIIRNLTSFGLEDVPYFIEDAKLMRDTLPFVANPMMIKDLAAFRDYLDNQPGYFDQDYLRDGTLWLTKEQLDYLIASGKTIPQRVHLKINVVEELSNDELTALQNGCTANGINLEGINVFDDRLNDDVDPNLHMFDAVETHLDTYSIDEYKQIRSELEEIVEGITDSMSEVEKFAVIYQRLRDRIPKYDIPAQGEAYSKEHILYQAKQFNKSRNLSEGLIPQEGFDIANNTDDSTTIRRAVCAGFSDILKNALKMVGVKALIEGGNAEKNVNTGRISGGHEWNRVRIDGRWYYCDLTWDIDTPSINNALKGSSTFIDTGNTVGDYEYVHYTEVVPGSRTEQMEQDDYDQAVLQQLFQQVRDGDLPPTYSITIPDDPDLSVPDVNIEDIRQKYLDRKRDMEAKYFGDRDYRRRYDEVAARYRSHEIERTDGGITYRTVEDYQERADDEEFLLLGEYKDSLERMTKYLAGDTSVYSGSQPEVQAQLERDQEYVSTRNHTFDQHRNTQRDLATLGKYGETLPYIQRQQGLLRNSLRVIGNVGIFARNLVAPIYRFVGRNVAQPIHRLVTGGRDASPYRNNPYHRFVARRDYFRDIAAQNDAANGQRHPIRNALMSNVRAVFRSREGNEAVLRAGAYDIQENLRNQELQRVELDFLRNRKSELEGQIAFLENEINNHPKAKNISEVQNRLEEKRNLLQTVNDNLDHVQENGRIPDAQTDAISDRQHDIASKEVNTYRVAVIKGVAKMGIRRFVGPRISTWLKERTRIPQEKTITIREGYNRTIVDKEGVDIPAEEGWITPPSETIKLREQASLSEMMSGNGGKQVTGFYSVYGGERGAATYTLGNNEKITGIFQSINKGGTGLSDKAGLTAPTLTDRLFDSGMIDGSGVLKQDISIEQLVSSLGTNVDLKELGDLYVSVGDKYWVKLSELTGSITELEKTEGVWGVIKEAIHEEPITHTVWVEPVTKTITEQVENERVVRALSTLGVSLENAARVDTVHNVAEIVRPTTSEENENKKRPRRYDYDDSEFYK